MWGKELYLEQSTARLRAKGPNQAVDGMSIAEMRRLMRKNIQYSFRRARPLSTAYFFNTSRYQFMVDSFVVTPY